jgi:nucleoside-diphosphate-sugar epimerase
MRVLVIGGTGFIGRHVVSALSRSAHEIAVFHRGETHALARPGRQLTDILGDRRHLADYAKTLRAFAPEVVVDVVLSSGRQARELLSVMRGTASRVVALSSCDVYRAVGITHRLEDGPPEPLPLTETSPLRSKLQTYPPAQLRMLQQVFGWLDDEYDKIPVEREILGDAELPGTVLRLPMVYGPGDPLHRFLPIVKRVADGRRFILVSADMAGWRATRGYVEDVGAAVALAATSPAASGRVFNVGEVDTLSELEWARAIGRAMGWDGEFLVKADAALPPFLRAPGNTAQLWITDTTRIRRELGYAEAVARDEAVRRTVAWEAANPPAGFTPHQFDYAAEDAARLLDPPV